MTVNNKRIFITGGAGYLGKHLIERWYKDNEITCFSRDEAKHYFLKKAFPKIRCIVGDVRDGGRLIRESRGHDIGLFAASLKQISSCDENPSEAVAVIVTGAINSRMAAEDNQFESACFISSDKACAATTIYGSCKFIAEQLFIVNARATTKLSSCRYGNVMNSTGSIIPLIFDAIKHNYPIQLYSEEMTRFMLTVQDAMSLVERSLGKGGIVVVPMVKSFKIKDLFEIYAEKFQLRYTISTPRVGEKLHEAMVSNEEFQRVKTENGDFLIHPDKTFSGFTGKDYSSKDFCVSKEELREILSSHNFFQ
jgi:UDP-N-acetylglucosamine 4,6-dehydratase